MAESIYIPSGASKADIYEALIPQISALIASETDRTAALANVTAVLKEVLGFFWVGFYIVKQNELVLGPFQGSLACTRIAYGKGVCGTAWQTASVQLVADVNAFPGHIACSSLSKSEIVIPIQKKGKIFAVLDIDSDKTADFDQTDNLYLNKIGELIAQYCF